LKTLKPRICQPQERPFAESDKSNVECVLQRGAAQVCHARVANVEIPNQKCIRYSLQYVYGVGDTTAQTILRNVSIDPAKRTHALSEDELTQIRDELENFTVEGDLRRSVRMNIKRCASPCAHAEIHVVMPMDCPTAKKVRSILNILLNIILLGRVVRLCQCCSAAQASAWHMAVSASPGRRGLCSQDPYLWLQTLPL
jgi:ribosomal protein S13